MAQKESSAAGGEMTMLKEPHEIWRVLPKKDWQERQEYIIRLTSYPVAEYKAELEQGIRNDDDADVRNAAMEVYRVLGARGFPSLKALLQDSNHEVRLFAVNILCSIADRGTYSLLADAMNDADVNVRVAAAEALGKIRDERAVAVLENGIDDEPWVAMAAIDALGHIGGEDALRILYHCLEIPDYQELAITAIGMSGKKESIKYLSGRLNHWQLCEHALKAILEITERENIRPDPEFFMHHMPMILCMLQSADPTTRTAAGKAVCWSRGIDAKQCLIGSVRDEDLREYAVAALRQTGERAVCGIVDEIRGSTGPHRVLLAKTLSMLGEHAALLQFAEDSDPELRTEVALALGSVSLPQAAETLGSMLRDPEEEVRTAAKKSLEKEKEVNP
jgi:HEAT repeat protein